MNYFDEHPYDDVLWTEMTSDALWCSSYLGLSTYWMFERIHKELNHKAHSNKYYDMGLEAIIALIRIDQLSKQGYYIPMSKYPRGKVETLPR